MRIRPVHAAARRVVALLALAAALLMATSTSAGAATQTANWQSVQTLGGYQLTGKLDFWGPSDPLTTEGISAQTLVSGSSGSVPLTSTTLFCKSDTTGLWWQSKAGAGVASGPSAVGVGPKAPLTDGGEFDNYCYSRHGYNSGVVGTPWSYFRVVPPGVTPLTEGQEGGVPSV